MSKRARRLAVVFHHHRLDRGGDLELSSVVLQPAVVYAVPGHDQRQQEARPKPRRALRVD